MNTNTKRLLCTLAGTTALLTAAAGSGGGSRIEIDLGKRGAEIPASLYGVFFEEITGSGDGGLYAEMIRNRGFEEGVLPTGCALDADGYAAAPHAHCYSNDSVNRFRVRWSPDLAMTGWRTQYADGSQAASAVTAEYPLNAATPHALRLDLAAARGEVSAVNSGYWGIAVEAGKSYDLEFYVRAEKTPWCRAAIVAPDGKPVAVNDMRLTADGGWHRYTATFTPSETGNKNTLRLTFPAEGRVWIDYVSLFPRDTYKGRANGLRKDVATMIEELRPAFVRWPGGCIVEGLTMENRVNWKNTIGKPELRKGEYNLWGYHSTNGFGYHEFLQYCEDMGAKAMFVCNAGMSCDGRNGDYYDDKEVEVLIQDALDAIEYATGDAKTTKWGAERAKNGHPAPFTLDYIEVGNENHSAMYAKYYNRFYKRIREAYPDITIITCLPMSDQLSWIDGYDMNDPHFYNFPSWFYANTDYFDKFPREEGHKTYVGEYACNMGVGSGNMEGALSEGAFMMGMERNSDLVTMTSYAPLMENTKCRMGVNLILVRNDDVIGRSSYWVERMFTDNRPDVNLATDTQLGVLPDKTTPVGDIGLGTYQTAAEYSNIRISVDGEQVYASDPENNPGEWVAASGDWKIEGGRLIQPDENGTGSIMLRDQWLDAVKSKIVSVEFDAKKLGGKEGFVLKFGAKDPANCYQLTLGSFGNAWTIFQSVADDNAFVLNTDRPTTRIETGRTYHVKLVIKDKDILECWIDGRKDLTYDNSYVQRQYAIAGLDRTNGEVIVKIINAEDVPMRTKLNFRNAEFEPQGRRISLWANSKHEENTFEERNRIVPVEDVFNNVSSSMDVTFRPQSMTVLRLKLKK